MKYIVRVIFFVFILTVPVYTIAQEAKPSIENSPATTKAQRKKAKEKWKAQRKEEMTHKKEIKVHHKRIQSKDTRKRMRQEKRKSERLRTNKKEFFLVRWFKNR